MHVPVATGRGWIEIKPTHPKPATSRTYRDHRIAMAFSISGLRTPGIELDDPGCVNKTYPQFRTAVADFRPSRPWRERIR